MSEIPVFVSQGPHRGPTFKVHVADFANVLKAFIGSNYLTIAFAFRQSGVGLGIAGLLLVATLTAHCCHLLVKCKYYAISHILEFLHRQSLQESDSHELDRSSSHKSDRSISYESDRHGSTEDNTATSRILNNNKRLCFEEKLQLYLNFGDLGQLCFGKAGVALVNAGIMITQFGFCVGYCIFIGNTVLAMFPMYNCTEFSANVSGAGPSKMVCVEAASFRTPELYINSPATATPNLRASLSIKKKYYQQAENSNLSRLISSEPTSHMKKQNQSKDTITLLPTQYFSFARLSRLDASNFLSMMLDGRAGKTSARVASRSGTSEGTLSSQLPEAITSELRHADGVPDLRLLVLCPLLIFIFLTLIRNVRQLGVVSTIANVAIFVGCVEVLIFLVVDFELSSTFAWHNIKDMPVFFGMVTSSYEGIGTILPIEASMVGNRHNFAKFLYGAVAFLTLILGGFGVLGYLRFGLDVQQMINANIPPGGTLSLAINTCLCIGVLLTFPLMMFPVVDLAEIYIFGDGRICGPRPTTDNDVNEGQSLLPQKKEIPIFIPVGEKVSNQVSTWKRNVLRVFIVVMAGGLAVLLRNSFAYVSAFVGALGSTLLAYILPCVFHLRLCWRHLPLLMKIKDIGIIVVGILCGIAGVYSVLLDIVKNESA